MALRTTFTPTGDHVDDHLIIHSVLNTSFNVRDPQFGAVGDGETDDTAAIQAAIDAAVLLGGGCIHIPAGTYKTTSPIYLYDNVSIIGDGYTTRINNIVESGFTKCVFIAGNIGNPDDETGVYQETYYAITESVRGTWQVTLTTAGDSNNFSVGDTVFLISTEVFTDNNRPYYVYVNIVTAISEGVLTLKYACPDIYNSIARLTGNLNGYDGNSHYMPRRVGISNLRISNAINETSGWYGMFLSCLESSFSNLWFDTVSKGIGANAASYNTFENIWINGYAAGIDLAYYCSYNRLSKIYFAKTTGTTAIGDIGISIHEEGSDNSITDFYIDVRLAGDTNGISSWHNHRTKFNNGIVLNAGGIGALVGGLSEGCEADSLTVLNSVGHGIFLSGSYNRIINCTVDKIGAEYHAIRVGEGSLDYVITGNILGKNGARAANDIIYDVINSGVTTGNIQYEAA